MNGADKPLLAGGDDSDQSSEVAARLEEGLPEEVWRHLYGGICGGIRPSAGNLAWLLLDTC